MCVTYIMYVCCAVTSPQLRPYLRGREATRTRIRLPATREGTETCIMLKDVSYLLDRQTHDSCGTDR